MITINDLDKMMERKEYDGFGYLGHECRNNSLDLLIVQELNKQNLDFSLSFLFLNSRPSRFMGDELKETESIEDRVIIINKYLVKEISLLRKEIQENN